jgi:aspartate carbamoyltransferase
MFKHLTSASQFKTETQLIHLFDAVDRMASPWQYNRDPLYMAKGKIMTTWFGEPSTRTRLSFESAMLRLGGTVNSVTNISTSSETKGESWDDTIKTLGCLSDIIVVRTATEGDVDKAAAISKVPVINAGDGVSEHPTQALVDLYTIYKHFGTCNGLSIGLVGDLKHSRVIHSLLKLINLHSDITYHVLHPSALGLNPQEYLQRGDLPVRYHKSIDELVDIGPNVVYMTRVQQERHRLSSRREPMPGHEYDPKLHFLNLKHVTKLPSSSIVMHALPREQEIAVEVDQDHRAAYWKQVKNGVHVRMALIDSMLEQ